jgi:hypothetical protein
VAVMHKQEETQESDEEEDGDCVACFAAPRTARLPCGQCETCSSNPH